MSYVSTPVAREKFRYIGVPVAFVSLGQVFGLWFEYTLASLVAATLVAIPNFFAGKHFAWRMLPRNNPRHTTFDSWAALMLSVLVATLFTYVAESQLADQPMPIRSAAVLFAQALGIGIVWALRLVILDGRWATRTRGEATSSKFGPAAQPSSLKLESIWNGTSRDVPHPKVSVIIPALNEERNLPHVAARMPNDIDEIVVINGASVDNTAEVARQLWPTALHINQTRKGKGNALACGIAAASGDIIVLIDSDGSTDPAEIPRYVATLMAGADYAKGSRFIKGGGSDDITKFRRLGNTFLNGTVNVLFSAKFTDLCYGYNAFWRRCLDAMDLPDMHATSQQWGDGFEIEALINVRVAASRLKIAEVCSYEKPRIYGSSNLRALSDGMRVFRTICTEFGSHRAEKRVLATPPPQAAGEVTLGEAAA